MDDAPYARNVHLLPDTADALGVDFGSLLPLAGGRDKSAFRPEDPPVTPHRLDLIVVLAPFASESAEGMADQQVTVSRVKGADRIQALIEHTNREGLAPLILGQNGYFTALAQLANSAPVYLLRRPQQGCWSLGQVLDEVERLAN